jgi:hypothetical protein
MRFARDARRRRDDVARRQHGGRHPYKTLKLFRPPPPRLVPLVRVPSASHKKCTHTTANGTHDFMTEAPHPSNETHPHPQAPLGARSAEAGNPSHLGLRKRAMRDASSEGRDIAAVDAGTLFPECPRLFGSSHGQRSPLLVAA